MAPSHDYKELSDIVSWLHCLTRDTMQVYFTLMTSVSIWPTYGMQLTTMPTMVINSELNVLPTRHIFSHKFFVKVAIVIYLNRRTCMNFQINIDAMC